MQIISDFKDYYDVIASAGQDLTLRPRASTRSGVSGSRPPNTDD